MNRRVPTGAGLVAIGIGLSRVSGLLRTALVGATFQLTAVADAFAAALRVPNVIQNLLGEGALSAAFIPEYSRLVDDDEEAAGQLASAIASFVATVAALLAVVGVVFARPITRAITWGFNDERFELTVRLVRILSIGAGVLVLSAWCLGVLNSHRRFFLSYVAPVLWNGAQIAVLVFVVARSWAPVDQATAVAWAVLVGALAQVAIQIRPVLRSNPSIGLSWRWTNNNARRVIRRLGPAIAGRGAMQISAFLDLALASLLAVGATAAIAWSQPLYLLPISIIGLSVAAAELPELSRTDDLDAITERVHDRLRWVHFLMSAVVAVFLGAGDLVVDAVYSLGGILGGLGPDDVLVVSITLAIFALGLPAIALSRLLQNVMFSQGDTRTPTTVSFLRISVAFLIGIALMFQFDQLLVYEGRITGIPDLFRGVEMLPTEIRENDALPRRLGATGLAFGSLVGAWVEYAVLRRAASDLMGGSRLATGLLASTLPQTAIAVGAGVTVRWLVPEIHVTIDAAIAVATILVVYTSFSTARRSPEAARMLAVFDRSSNRRL